MSLRKNIGSVVVAAGLLGGVSVALAPAANAATHRQMVYGSTLYECQNSLNNAANTYANAGKDITGVDSCVKNTQTAGGFNNYYGSVLWDI
ncbi:MULTISPECIES: hypothetical protein [Pseudoclavibacter]|uniref:Secreted protein n=1 Tax=Pseudoclavibacter terrae TaxID=1530195 RepID=A0A7J5AZA9_9MICO|nr:MULTISPECIES: hypothetical protein [Pseudoclavibacter]KAB1636786.1 hypothetical protein F8O03_14545 [Pseudoclavibacter terrae]PPG43833.1 hypothetical protein C5C17_00045 [Pseudoclavibacter sp. RFBA6]